VGGGGGGRGKNNRDNWDNWDNRGISPVRIFLVGIFIGRLVSAARRECPGKWRQWWVG
jgi:hypothetical protein